MLVLFLVAYYGDDCVVAGKILQTCKTLYKRRKELIDRYTVIHRYNENTTEYTLNDVLHKDDGPAYDDGNISVWVKNGRRCNPKPGVPGYICISRNVVQYYVDGELHRIGGPAVESKDGDEYWIHGERIK